MGIWGEPNPLRSHRFLLAPAAHRRFDFQPFSPQCFHAFPIFSPCIFFPPSSPAFIFLFLSFPPLFSFLPFPFFFGARPPKPPTLFVLISAGLQGRISVSFCALQRFCNADRKRKEGGRYKTFLQCPFLPGAAPDVDTRPQTSHLMALRPCFVSIFPPFSPQNAEAERRRRQRENTSESILRPRRILRKNKPPKQPNKRISFSFFLLLQPLRNVPAIPHP